MAFGGIKVTDERVLQLLEALPNLTTEDVAAKLHVSYTAAYYHLDSLWIQGKIDRTFIPKEERTRWGNKAQRGFHYSWKVPVLNVQIAPLHKSLARPHNEVINITRFAQASSVERNTLMKYIGELETMYSDIRTKSETMHGKNKAQDTR